MTEEERKLQQSSYDQAIAMASEGAQPTYAGTYDKQIQDIYDRIQNREPFQYHMNVDPLYQMYKDQYVAGGQRAMKDTMGQAAALTGGYGNTYAQHAGQQSYDQYMEGLAAKIPELYSMAYQRYADEGDRLMNQYNMLGQMRDAEYGKYRDSLGDWRYDTETAKNDAQTAKANLMAMIQAFGYSPTDAELQAAGMTRDQVEGYRHMFYMNNPAEWQLMQQQMGILPQQTAQVGGGDTYYTGTGTGAGGTGAGGGGGTGKKYTLQDYARDVAMLQNKEGEGSTQDNFYKEIMAQAKKGNTDFTQAELNAFIRKNMI